MPILALLGGFLLLLPLTSAFLAQRLGRSFFWWFVIGLVLPVIAVFILLMFSDQSAPKESERASGEDRSENDEKE
jgi:hypothetical protein